MTGISDFVQQSHNFIASKVSLRRISAANRKPRTWQTRGEALIDGAPRGE
jgi:hypothetical protein